MVSGPVLQCKMLAEWAKFAPKWSKKSKPKPKAPRRRKVARQAFAFDQNLGWWQNYTRYLESSTWLRFRQTVLKKRGKRCEDCGHRGSVQLHHLTYQRIGRERPEDVLVLCHPCHQKRHPGKAL